MSTERKIDDLVDAQHEKLSSFARNAGKSCAKNVFDMTGRGSNIGVDEGQLALICAIAVAATMHAVEKHLGKTVGDEIARLMILPMANV